MSLNDTLSNAMSNIMNHERLGRQECMLKTPSKTVKTVLDILKTLGYIGGYRELADAKGNMLMVALSGKINKCGSIKPRFAVKYTDYEKYEKRYLLAKNFGVLIVSTSKGMMTHVEAKEKKIGGKLLAYCY